MCQIPVPRHVGLQACPVPRTQGQQVHQAGRQQRVPVCGSPCASQWSCPGSRWLGPGIGVSVTGPLGLPVASLLQPTHGRTVPTHGTGSADALVAHTALGQPWLFSGLGLLLARHSLGEQCQVLLVSVEAEGRRYVLAERVLQVLPNHMLMGSGKTLGALPQGRGFFHSGVLQRCLLQLGPRAFDPVAPSACWCNLSHFCANEGLGVRLVPVGAQLLGSHESLHFDSPGILWASSPGLRWEEDLEQ